MRSIRLPPYMKWIVAFIGAVLVLFGATMGLLLSPMLVYPQLYESIAGVVFAWVVATPLGVLAAALSFRATLRHYAKPSRPRKDV